MYPDELFTGENPKSNFMQKNLYQKLIEKMQNSITDIRRWLLKPIPFFENYRQKIIIPTLLSFIVMIGIIILNPYENTDDLLRQIVETFKYGSIIISISLIFSFILPEVFPTIFKTEEWNIIKSLIFFLTSLITIAIFTTAFAYLYDNQNNKSFFLLFFTILTRSIVLAFFPIVILIYYSERILFKKNHARAIVIIDELKADQPIMQKKAETAIFTFAKNTKDEINISEHELLYVKAEGNYCLLVYEKESDLLKHLIRGSLKEAELLISRSEFFYRCHKSYIVNLNKITDVKGNAKGFIFFLQHECMIPTSRNISKSLIRKIRINKIPKS
jgi:hypothetical protein